MGEAPPLVRQWILLRVLCARHHGATVKELSTEMGVTEKTIRRDLETFLVAGFPLVETVEQFGRKKWRIDTAAAQQKRIWSSRSCERDGRFCQAEEEVFSWMADEVELRRRRGQ